MKKIYGLTLIELLFALTISLLIFSIVRTIFLTTEKSFSTQHALSSIQENARNAIELLQSDIHAAGYIGCAKLNYDFPLKNFPGYEFTSKNKIVVNENTITLRHASVNHTYLTRAMQDSSTLHTTLETSFFADEILLISDCKSAEIFKVKKASANQYEQSITTTAPLSNQYLQNAEVSKLEINTYFIGKTSRQSRDGSPIYALYMTDVNKTKLELVEGVDGMKTVLTDNGVDLVLQLSAPENPSLHKIWYDWIATA